MATLVSMTVTRTFDDGTTETDTVSATVANPSDTEIDVLSSDGTVKKWVPAQ